MKAANDVSGRCLCGAVTLQLALASLDVDSCHCSMCRRWSGGPCFALEHEGPVIVTGEDHINIYHSSEWADRAFCKTCGTSLYWRLRGSDYYTISAGLFDAATDYHFKKQIFIDEKPAFYDFANDTEKLTGAEVIAAFAAGASES
jgi:hypothetical protein